MTEVARVIDLGAQQLDVIARCRSFLVSQARNGTDVALTPECYLNAWARVPGNARLRQLAGERGGIVRLALACAKDALHYAAQAGYEVFDGAASTKGFTRLVVSWSVAGDFSSDGAYYDRYFRIGSRETPGTLWFLIAFDRVVPRQLDPNIVVFRQIPGARSTAALRLLQAAMGTLRRAPQRVDGSVPVVSAMVTLAGQVAAAVVAQLKGKTIRSVLLPYEAQPLQHALFRAVKRHDATIRTIGYLHSALPPLPTDLIARAGAPDLLLVHGPGQADILVRHLGWSRAALRTIKSLRYRIDDPQPLGGRIFLPYSFAGAGVIEMAFRDFVRAAAPRTLPALIVRNHPLMHNSKRHLRLQRRLEALMSAFADRFCPEPPSQPPVSIFIGATAAILEALERGVTALHICSRPLIESHSAQLWENLKVERLGEYLFRYELRTAGTYIEFGPPTVETGNETVGAWLGLPSADEVRGNTHQATRSLHHTN
jgi:hypothetical protein